MIRGWLTRRPLPLIRPAFAALLLFALWSAADRTPSGPAAGTELHGAAPSAALPATLRLATFNIHSGVGSDGRLDLARTGKSLDRFDLVALNEVRDPSWIAPDQAESLGTMLQRRWLFAPSERRWWHNHFGNGVVTQLPVSDWLQIPLPSTRGKGFRNAVLLTVPLAEGDVRVLLTHIDRSHDREAQLRTVFALFLALAEPAVLLGDLNSTASDPQLAALLATPGVADAIGARETADGKSAPAGIARRIDWILTRGLRRLDSGTEDRGASDHPLVWAELALPVRNARSR